MKAKKVYRKPRLTQVRLVLMNPVLANCNSVNDMFSGDAPFCNDPGAACSDVGNFP
jgi:hypothetical protein